MKLISKIVITLLIAIVSCQLLGCKKSNPVDSNPPNANLFSLPATVGTRWTYQYYWDSQTVVPDLYDHRVGTWVWEIASVSSQHDSVICRVQSTAVDSVHQIQSSPGFPKFDTTYVATVLSSFSIVTTSNAISLDLNKLMLSPGFSQPLAIPRTAVTDTLTTGDYNSHNVIFLRDVGLLSYKGDRYLLSVHCAERLTLVDKVIK
jgi:hypothetical protein